MRNVERRVLVVGSLVVGSLVVGSLVVGSLVVGSLVVGSLVVGSLVMASLANAQSLYVNSAVEGGAGRVHVDTFTPATLTSLTGMMAVTSRRYAIRADALASRFVSGRIASYGNLWGNLNLRPSDTFIRLSLDGDAGTGRYRATTTTEYVRTALRGELGDRTRIWGALGMGASNDTTSYRTSRAELGTWLQRSLGSSLLNISLSAAGLRAHADGLRGSNSYTRTAGDFGGSTFLQLRQGASVQLSGGFRLSRSLNDVQRWGEFQSEVPFAGRMSIVGAVGRALNDLERALPAARYGNVSLRIRLGPTHASVLFDPAATSAHIAALLGTASNDTAASRLTAPATDGTRTFSVRMPTAHTVELMADFTEWHPIAMTRDAAGVWRARVSPPSGIHPINIRVDGGPWQVPPGLAATEDGLGGRAGALVVP